MENSTILFAISKECPDADLSRILEAARVQSVHVAVLIVGEMPQIPIYSYGAPPYGTTVIPEDWQNEARTEQDALNAKTDAVEALLKRHDVSGDITIVCSEPSLTASSVARRAMLCDLAIASDDLRKKDDLYRQVVHGILFQSPTGVILNSGAGAALAPKHVLVAWNASLQCARAVHQSLAILRQSDAVTVAVFDPEMSEFQDGENPGSDVAKWLTHHGCNVTVQQLPSGGREIGDCILEQSRQTGADLIVMGGYGHSRLREGIFGGTTRTLVQQTEQPVFLAH
ncbi:universal stress protein [Sulfitobacter sp. JL08]|uniref:universal stress protein n=1 Tax=Sulfitobacter sp. JL08 TaxID=2070369 RepID=UPI000E0A82FE|nr:universal stress protein [Sulfitobacter sp. JL08]AXI54176.1 universal stress protein [Sulfitobacter sp. JL08]